MATGHALTGPEVVAALTQSSTSVPVALLPTGTTAGTLADGGALAAETTRASSAEAVLHTQITTVALSVPTGTASAAALAAEVTRATAAEAALLAGAGAGGLTAAQVGVLIAAALANLGDGTTTSYAGGKLSVIGPAVVPAVGALVPATDLVPILRGTTALTATQAQLAAFAASASGTAPAAPGAASAFAAGTPGSTTVGLTWTAPSTGGAVAQYLLEQQAGSGAFTTVSSSVTGTSYSVAGLTPGTAYTFRLTPSNSGGAGPAVTVAATTAAAQAASPTLTVSGVSPLVAGGTSTASLTFGNGAPATLTATLDGAALTLSNVSITTNSGTGATAAGTASFAFTTPAAGGHTLIVTGTGTYASSAGYPMTTTAAAASSNVTNALTFGFYTPLPASVALSNTYNGYAYNSLTGAFTLATASGAISPQAANVVFGWGTSATVPPGPASHAVSSTITTNGYVTNTNANTNYFYADTASVAVTTGSSPSPGTARYFWASNDNGSTWSVYGGASPVAVLVIG